MNLLFVMDELSRIHPKKDTTYLLIQETFRRSDKVYFCGPPQLKVKEKKVFADCCEIEKLTTHSQDSSQTVFSLGEISEKPLKDFSIVFMRKDPPFDLHYLTSLYVLEKAKEDTLVINNPTGLFHCNEKLMTLNFLDLCPDTLVSSNSREIKIFVKKHGGKAVLKPIYLAGGEGIFLLQIGDRNMNSILEKATLFGKETVLIQRYLPEVENGDKRLIVLDGEPVGAVLRLAEKDELRSNIHVGGECVKTEITPNDQKICERLKPTIKEQGLFFVGLDIIGDYVTEINVTSPTGFQEINRLDHLKKDQTLEAKFFDRLLEKFPTLEK